MNGAFCSRACIVPIGAPECHTLRTLLPLVRRHVTPGDLNAPIRAGDPSRPHENGVSTEILFTSIRYGIPPSSPTKIHLSLIMSEEAAPILFGLAVFFIIFAIVLYRKRQNSAKNKLAMAAAQMTANRPPTITTTMSPTYLVQQPPSAVFVQHATPTIITTPPAPMYSPAPVYYQQAPQSPYHTSPSAPPHY